MTNTLSTSISTGITLASGGNYQSPFTITSTGTVAPTAYSAIGVYGSAASGLTLINQGVIDGGGGQFRSGASGGAGVDLLGAGSFSNSGTITGGTGGIGPGSYPLGLSGAGGAGVDLSGAGSFSNSGIITGGVGGGNVKINANGGAGGTGVDLSGADTFSNSGTITGGNGGAGDFNSDSYGGAGGTGVDSSGTGSFINSGTITGGGGGYGAHGGAGGTGVDLTGGGSFSNIGIIIGGYGSRAEVNLSGMGGTGVDLASGGSFSNSGTITGGNAGKTGLPNVGGTGVDLSGAGSFSNGGTGLITGGGGSSNTGGTGGAGVDLTGGGSFGNSGTITGGGSGTGGDGGTGVDLTGTGSFSNIGNITGGNARDGQITGAGGTGVDLSGAGSFSNGGTITGGTGGNSTNMNDRSGNGGVGVGVNLTGGGSFSNSGTITGGAGGSGGSNGGAGGTGAYLNGGTLLNSGVIAGAQGADAVQFGTNAGTLIVEHGASFTGNVVANATIADVLAIGGTTPVTISNIGAEYQNFHTLAFEAGASGTAAGTYTAMDALTISSFAQGDTLVLNGFAATSDTYVSGTGLELSNGTSQITLDITGNFTTANFNVIDPPANTTISLNPPCFAEGTRILTARGEIPVEQLSAGDQVILHSGGIAPITWIGHRALAPSRHPNPEQVNPIRICAGALENNIPQRDLVLSPDHALYLNGALIPAKSLLNGSTIRQEARRRITYFHVELAAHDVIYAEGTPAESYLETGNRNAFANGGGALTLHPDFAQKLREQTGCAPFAEFGPVVEKTRAQILARTNQHLTTDPGLTLHTNQDGSIIIASRSAIPGQLNPDPRDQRILGVKILSLHAGAQRIPLAHPLLTEGWHGVEADGRWTNGRAMIPAALAKHGPITLKLAATLAYPTEQPTQHRTRQRA